MCKLWSQGQSTKNADVWTDRGCAHQENFATSCNPHPQTNPNTPKVTPSA